MKVLLPRGWYDLATPFFGAEDGAVQEWAFVARPGSSSTITTPAHDDVPVRNREGAKLSNDVRALSGPGQ